MSHADSLSILLVDDSSFFVSLLSDKLESNYCMVTTTATSAQEALEELETKTVDCVVSDYEMPTTSGLELYEQVDEQYDLPFILLTGGGDEEIASQAIRKGVDDYILKQSVRNEEPIELLVNRIRNVVVQRRAQRKYEQLVDNSPDEIVQLSLDGEILAANESFATAVGESQRDVLDQHLATFLPDEVAASRLEESKRAITAGSAVTFQDTIGMRHFHNIAVPLSTVGEEDSIQLVTREITLQKRHEQELERKSEKLTLINRIVRHDINNDVQLLIAWTDFLKDHVDEAGMEYVERIDDTSNHINELTTIARDFVESLADGTEMELDPVDVSRVLESEVEKKRATFDEAVFVAETFPKVTVLANELLSSVFANLLSNAVRHNDAQTPEVHISVEETTDDVVIRVADNGPGVPDDQKEEIFGKGSMGPESPGTGVGLYLVYTLIDQYGGQVWVADNDPSGAIFCVELPKLP